jgi:hypothetical protein
MSKISLVFSAEITTRVLAKMNYSRDLPISAAEHSSGFHTESPIPTHMASQVS